MDSKIETFEQLYEAWAKDYFKKVSPSSVRTVTSTYKYCSAGYNMLIKQMGSGIMKQEKLQLFTMDMKYVRDLHKVDDRVQSVSPQIIE